MFAAKLDAGKCIQAVEEQPSLCAACLVSRVACLVYSFCPPRKSITTIDGGRFWRELRKRGSRMVGHTVEISEQRYTSNYYQQPNADKIHSDQNIYS